MSDTHENESKILELWKTGLTTQDCIGLHGTSKVTLALASQTGFIPGKTNDLASIGEIGDLFFYPLKDTLSPEIFNTAIHPEYRKKVTIKYAQRFSLDYATAIAQKHSVLQKINLDIAEFAEIGLTLIEDFIDRPLSLDSKYVQQLLDENNISTESSHQAIAYAQRYQGIVMGVHRRIFDYFSYTQGPDGDHVQISPGTRGTSLDYFSGLAPVGPWERLFLLGIAARHRRVSEFIDLPLWKPHSTLAK